MSKRLRQLITQKGYFSNKVSKTMAEVAYDYDFCVIGGGSGGLSAAKAASNLGAKVAVFDYVSPTPIGTKWGLGGTCVNVGCIPKKLMHSASLLGEQFSHDMPFFGWEYDKNKTMNWTTLVENITNHIRSVNFAYALDLRKAKASYINAQASFLDPHTVEYNLKGEQKTLTSKYFLVAVGGRPTYPDLPGAKESCITSDDVFKLEKPPGKTLVVGASYVALECAGFLQGIGYDTTTMIRSIPLRGFDQQMALKIVDYMEHFCGVRFIKKSIPLAFNKLENGLIEVEYENGETHEKSKEIFETVLLAIGRTAETAKLRLDRVGVKINDSNRKIIVNDHDQTSVSNIYAVGDVAHGKPELTPVAVQAGKLLAERLFGNQTKLMDYVNVATTVFTPIEYGAIGYSEEHAIEKFGDENIEVYHMQASAYEQTIVPEREEFPAYCKLIVNKSDHNRVIGFHVLAPNAGEITQGFSVAIRLKATKEDFDDTVGIHPTTAELFCQMAITKRSGKPLPKGGCPSCA